MTRMKSRTCPQKPSISVWMLKSLVLTKMDLMLIKRLWQTEWLQWLLHDKNLYRTDCVPRRHNIHSKTAADKYHTKAHLDYDSKVNDSYSCSQQERAQCTCIPLQPTHWPCNTTDLKHVANEMDNNAQMLASKHQIQFLNTFNTSKTSNRLIKST